MILNVDYLGEPDPLRGSTIIKIIGSCISVVSPLKMDSEPLTEQPAVLKTKPEEYQPLPTIDVTVSSVRGENLT